MRNLLSCNTCVPRSLSAGGRCTDSRSVLRWTILNCVIFIDHCRGQPSQGPIKVRWFGLAPRTPGRAPWRRVCRRRRAGLSPDLQSMEQIRRIMRPTDVPDQGLLCDLLWSDPDKETMGWGENDRGVSFTFGAEVVAKFLHKHDLDLICRAHQVGERPLLLGHGDSRTTASRRGV